jgi:hypothetical protein
MTVPDDLVQGHGRSTDRRTQAETVRQYRAATARRRQRERSRVALATSRSRLLVGLTPSR